MSDKKARLDEAWLRIEAQRPEPICGAVEDIFRAQEEARFKREKTQARGGSGPVAAVRTLDEEIARLQRFWPEFAYLFMPVREVLSDEMAVAKLQDARQKRAALDAEIAKLTEDQEGPSAA